MIFVQSICIILLLRHKYSASFQHRRNRCQPALPTARCPPRANGGTPVPAPMVALPFPQVLTSVRPTPVPPTPHQVHPSHPSHLYHPAINQPVYTVRPGAGKTASCGIRRCKYFQKTNTPLPTIFRYHLNTISSKNVSSNTLTLNPMKNPGMGDPISPLAPVYLSRLPPPVIKGGVLIFNEAATLVLRKVGFSGNYPYKRRHYWTNLYLQLLPLLHGVDEYIGG